MSHAQRIDEVRREVTQAFARMEVAEPSQFRETILLHRGAYCGRRFEADGAYAIWFLEEDEVKFYRTSHSAAEHPSSLESRMAA